MSDILPKWLSKNVPEVSACALVGYDEIKDLFWVKEHGQNSSSLYKSMDEVMKESCANNLSIDPSISKVYRVLNNCLVNASSTEFYVVKNESFRLDSLTTVFSQWRDLYDLIMVGDLWTNAYHFISIFPALWVPAELIPTFAWHQNGGHDFVEHSVIDGKIYMNLFVDGETPVSLNVEAKSFEDAYVELAKEIIRYFDNDAVLREDFKNIE